MNNISGEQPHKELDQRLSRGYELWRTNLSLNIPEKLKYFASDAVSATYNGKFLKELCIACQCFLWFRYLHDVKENEEDMSARTLLGDYFFSQFSIALIPIDSTELIDRFSDFLKQDINKELDLGKFSKFFGEVSGVLNE